MRYNVKKLTKAANNYKKNLKKIKGKTILVILDLNNKKAFYSLAPLSKAIHELDGDMNVKVINKTSAALNILKDVWKTYFQLKNNKINKNTKALDNFLKTLKKKCPNLETIFEPPNYIIKASKSRFEGDFSLPYNNTWLKEYKKSLLIKTAKVIFKQVYNLKKSEKVSIGFDLVRKNKDLGLPLEDYLDQFQISYAIAMAVKKQVAGMGASTSRKSQLAKPERISELRTTLLGLELCKDVNEPIFRAFRKLSKLLKINRFKVAPAVFGIHGKGYSGRHYFGECIGYPSQDKKTRWLSPGQMVYKLDFYPQTKHDPRSPKARVAFTETIPIDIFIKTNNIDWLAMQKRNNKIINIAKKCDHIIVKGKKFGKYQTKLKVGLVSKQGKRRNFKGSDVDTRSIINKEHLKQTGIKAGTMANLPGGEAFVTPEYVEGQFIGDVVISLDQSYILSPKKPFIVNCFGNKHRVIEAKTDVFKKFKQKKKESWKKLVRHEKNGALPKEIIKINKKNFHNIGEFAINTNPKAELCNYLIVNEKIANMIHIALGSGFEPDRATYYHTDIVINSPRQELNIYGVTKNGKKYWIHKKGKFVV